MKRTNRKFTIAFKTKISIDALKERETLSELANRLRTPPDQPMEARVFEQRGVGIRRQRHQKGRP